MVAFPTSIPSFRSQQRVFRNEAEKGWSQHWWLHFHLSWREDSRLHFHLSWREDVGCDHSATKRAEFQEKQAVDRLFPSPKANHSQEHTPPTSWMRNHRVTRFLHQCLVCWLENPTFRPWKKYKGKEKTNLGRCLSSYFAGRWRGGGGTLPLNWLLSLKKKANVYWAFSTCQTLF